MLTVLRCTWQLVQLQSIACQLHFQPPTALITRLHSLPLLQKEVRYAAALPDQARKALFASPNRFRFVANKRRLATAVAITEQQQQAAVWVNRSDLQQILAAIAAAAPLIERLQIERITLWPHLPCYSLRLDLLHSVTS